MKYKCPKCNAVRSISDRKIAKYLAGKGGKAKKKFSKSELKVRSDRLKKARLKRWPKKGKETTGE